MSGICDTCSLNKGCHHKLIGNVDSCWRYERAKESNYQRFFGTPKRAARTLARMCAIGDGSCAGCPMFNANLEHCKSDYTHLKSIVEWLRGDAE